MIYCSENSKAKEWAVTGLRLPTLSGMLLLNHLNQISDAKISVDNDYCYGTRTIVSALLLQNYIPNQ